MKKSVLKSKLIKHLNYKKKENIRYNEAGRYRSGQKESALEKRLRSRVQSESSAGQAGRQSDCHSLLCPQIVVMLIRNIFAHVSNRFMFDVSVRDTLHFRI